MTLEEEGELITRYQNGDESVLGSLVSENIALVRLLAKRHYKVNSHLSADLEQEGVIGLIQAFKRYKPEYAKQFGYYKSIWVRKMMSSYVKKHSDFGSSEEVENFHAVTGDSSHKILFDEVTDMVSESKEFTKREKESFIKAISAGKVPRKKIREKIQSIYEKDNNRTFGK